MIAFFIYAGLTWILWEAGLPVAGAVLGILAIIAGGAWVGKAAAGAALDLRRAARPTVPGPVASRAAVPARRRVPVPEISDEEREEIASRAAAAVAEASHADAVRREYARQVRLARAAAKVEPPTISDAERDEIRDAAYNEQVRGDFAREIERSAARLDRLRERERKARDLGRTGGKAFAALQWDLKTEAARLASIRQAERDYFGEA